MIGQLLGTGNTANVDEWGKTEILKVFHDRNAAAHEAAKEANNAALVNKLKLRAPGFSGIVEYEGSPGLVYEKIQGPTMLACIEPTIGSVSGHARLLAKLQHELHQVESDADSNLKRELAACIRRTKAITAAEQAIVLGTLDALPEKNMLCHYDFHPGNIILSHDGPVIIDWVNALVGDPAADVARTSTMIRSTAMPPNAPIWLAEREYRILFHETYLEEYVKLSDMDSSSIHEWLVPVLAARIDELRGTEQLEIVSLLKSLI